MKYVIIICDGMADYPVKQLNGKTPIEHAYAPNIQFLAKNGQVGRMKTIFEGLPVGSIVANLGIMGFDPHTYYPNGRASFEALAQGITVNENDLVFRCNLISTENEKIKDFTSNNISDGHAKNIITHLGIDNVEIFPGQSYRNLLVFRNVNVKADEIETFEPHRFRGSNINDILPKGKTEAGEKIAVILRKLMFNSIDRIKDLNVNFKTDADMIWPWSPSSKPNLPSFYDTFGKTGSIVAAMDFMKGIGISAKMHFEDIPGANGYINTNYENKLKYTQDFLEDNDFVYLHINSTDEEGHNRNVDGKLQAIEDIDHRVIGPLILHLRKTYNEDFRIAILPDHITCVTDGHHYEDDIPYLVYGKNIKADNASEYSEITGKNSDQYIISYDFMTSFLDIN